MHRVLATMGMHLELKGQGGSGYGIQLWNPAVQRALPERSRGLCRGRQPTHSSLSEGNRVNARLLSPTPSPGPASTGASPRPTPDRKPASLGSCHAVSSLRARLLEAHKVEKDGVEMEGR